MDFAAPYSAERIRLPRYQIRARTNLDRTLQLFRQNRVYPQKELVYALKPQAFATPYSGIASVHGQTLPRFAHPIRMFGSSKPNQLEETDKVLYHADSLHPVRTARIFAWALIVLASMACPHGNAQGALLMEEPYGFFGTLNPTGHNAIYLEHVCAATPLTLRRCHAGELGSVIARYQGIKGYDWIAMPLVPYLYSVENPADVPARVDRDTVLRLRDRYRETHLYTLGRDLPEGGFLRGGWTELVGVSYERRIFAFRFNTTREQDDRLIAQMNAATNQSRFNLLFNNCADFARNLLDFYMPGTFSRSIFPDAGMTTPKQIAYKLTRYARQHPEAGLAVFEISQVPGYHSRSRSNKSVAESLTTTAYAIPIAAMNPYLAGGLFVDYLVRGRHHLIPKHPVQVGPANLAALTAPALAKDNPSSAGLQATSAADVAGLSTSQATGNHFDLPEGKAAHE
jgi:hypothetical protein